MPGNIVNGLVGTTKKVFKETLAKYILGTLYVGSFLVPSIIGANYFYNIIRKENPKEVVEKLFKSEEQDAKGAIYDLVKKKPELIDRFCNSYKARARLENALDYGLQMAQKRNELANPRTVSSKSSSNKPVFNSSRSVSLDGLVYFSPEEMSPNSYLTAPFKMICDPQNGSLYRPNAQQQKLEKLTEGVEELVSVSEGTFFTQGNGLFKISSNGEIKKISNVEGKHYIRNVEGSDVKVIFGEKDLLFLNVKDLAGVELKERVRNLCGPQFVPCQNTKIVYNPINLDDGIYSLYANDSQRMHMLSGSKKGDGYIDMGGEIIDYVVRDINGDGAKEMAVAVKTDKGYVVKVHSGLNSLYDVDTGWQFPILPAGKNVDVLREEAFRAKMKNKVLGSK